MEERITSMFPRVELRGLLPRARLALAMVTNRLLPESWDEMVAWFDDDDAADDAMATFAAAYAILEKAVHQARARRREKETSSREN
jgi:hypothetical protein